MPIVTRPKLRKPTKDEWKCSCGAISPNASPRCVLCEALNNPRLRKSHRPQKPPSAGCWRCAECRGETPEPLPFCNVCNKPTNPRLTPNQATIAEIVTMTEGDAKSWEKLRLTGGDDAEIAVTLRKALGPNGSVMIGGVEWRWHLSDVGTLLRVQAGEPTSEKNLVAAVRTIYQIPQAQAGQNVTVKDVAKSDRPKAAARATKKAAAPAAATNGKTSPAKAVPAPVAAAVHEIPIDRVIPSPLNPRKHFDQEALDRLAATIKQDGLLQPLVVRPAGPDGRHELIAGERRLRAARIAGLKTVPCLFRDPDAATTSRLRLIENFIREGLNAIEEALSFLELTTTHGVTQKQLADELSVSPSYIANRIRLLELPDAWQAKIVSQEIPPTHARYLLPWAKYPAVLQELEPEFKKDADGETITVDLLKDCIEDAVFKHSRAVQNTPFKLTPKRSAELDIVEVTKPWGAKIKRAMNVEAFDRMCAEADEAKRKKAADGRKKEMAADDEEDDSADAPKRSAAEEKEAREKKAKQAQKRLWMYRLTWQQRQVVEILRALNPVDHDADRMTLLRLAVFFVVNPSIQSFSDAFQEIGKKATFSASASQAGEWKLLTTIDEPDALRVVQALAAEAVEESNPFSYHASVKDEGIEELWRSLGGTFESWRLDETFLSLFTKAELLDLAKEWKVTRNPVWQNALVWGKRTDLVEAFLEIDKTSRLPATKAMQSVKKPSGVQF